MSPQRERPADEVRRLLEDTGAIKRGHFVLSSGLHSDGYCQCAALFERPDVAGRVGELGAMLARELVGSGEIDVVVSPALGGVLWGYEVARGLGVRSVFAERVEGRFALRRGFALPEGARALLAEDVVTTGGSVMELKRVIDAMDAEVAGIVSVVDRSAGGFSPGCPFGALVDVSFATYEAARLPAELAAIPIEQPGSRRLDPARAKEATR